MKDRPTCSMVSNWSESRHLTLSVCIAACLSAQSFFNLDVVSHSAPLKQGCKHWWQRGLRVGGCMAQQDTRASAISGRKMLEIVRARLAIPAPVTLAAAAMRKKGI